MLDALEKIPRNAALLIMLLVLVLVSPSIGGPADSLIIELLFDAVLIAGVYSAGTEKHRHAFWLMTLVTVAYRWFRVAADPASAIEASVLGLTLVWIGWAIVIIVSQHFRERDVTVDTIVGAVVAYLLIAVAFAIAYELLEVLQPGSFDGIPDDAATSRAKLVPNLMYFSLICLTTMGFGDIVPVSDVAKPIAALEGLLGQVYLAVMVARLVGLHIGREQRS